MRRGRTILVGFLFGALALLCWYLSRPKIVLLADGLFLETEWAQGDHDTFFPLLKKGWRLQVHRVERLPLENDALTQLMDDQHAQVLVTSPRLTALIDEWHMPQPGYRLAGITRGPVQGSAFDVVMVEDLSQGYRESLENSGPPLRLISSVPIPDAIAKLFPVQEMVDGTGSDVYVRSRLDAWMRDEPHRDLIVYEIGNLALYQGVPLIVPAGSEPALSNDQILGLIVTDFSPIASLATTYPENRQQLTFTLESHFRSAARMSGGYLAQALAAWRRKFL
ncbi:MAG: hypothetical protein SPF89_09420 [Sphaerochaetaceae bacterium]|nr:hypothetical protein [Spirochaetales bacterium]MDY5500311.1 hypothetical protein [Sphaerochaetaceae bacterium]